MFASRYQLLKFIGLFVGFTAKFVTGSVFVFNVYQDAIKETFNYTQKEVELLSSMLNVGLGIGFVPGMFYDRFGPTFASGAGLIVSVPVLLLIWSTTKYVHFYSNNAWLMSIYFLLCGFGSVFTYMVALNTNVINFDKKHTGKIVGFLNAFFAGSPSIFATIYYNIFTDGDYTIVSNQDYPGFILFLAVLYGCANLLCMIFLRVYINPEKKQNDDVAINYYKDSNGIIIDSITKVVNGKDNMADTSEIVNTPEEDETKPLSLGKLLCSVEFQVFAWMFACASSVGLVYGNNITVSSKSVGLDGYNDKLVIIVPITNAIVSSLIGILSDYAKDKISRITIVTIGCLSYVVCQAIVVVFVGIGLTLTVFVIATVFTGIGTGILWSLSPTIMKEKFSVEHLGRNWGLAVLLAAAVGFASQEGFGAMYDANVTEGVYCYGAACIKNGYIVFLCVGVVSVLLGLFLIIRNKYTNKT